MGILIDTLPRYYETAERDGAILQHLELNQATEISLLLLAFGIYHFWLGYRVDFEQNKVNAKPDPEHNLIDKELYYDLK
jgi:hypothetical protein